MFTLNNLRHSWKEAKGFRLLREKGTCDYVFLHFISSVEISLEKRKVRLSPGTCIIYPPGSYQEFHSRDTILDHDWIHFDIKSPDLFDTLGIPVNRPFLLRETGFITSMTSIMEMEYINRNPFWEKNVDGMLISMFSLIGREFLSDNTAKKHQEDMRKGFDTLRLELFNSPSLPWDIDMMAKKTNLSRSRFCALYREFFSSSPISDLISARIERAKYLLSNTDICILEVSYESGYRSVEHFIRQFKLHTGSTPAGYRLSV